MITFFSRKLKTARNALIVAGVIAGATQVAASGLPGEYVISDRWRHVYSMYSGITNPAFINEENYMTLRFLFANTLQEFYMQEAGFTMPLGLYNTAGISWMMQGVNSYEAINPEGVGTGRNIVDQSHFVALSYSHNVWAGLTVAGNLNIIAQNVANIDVADQVQGNEMRFGFGIDIGLTYKLLRHPLIGNHILGVSTNNIFNMILDTDEKYAEALRVSLLSDFWERRIYYGADFVLKDLLLREDMDLSPGSVAEMPWEFSQKLGFNVLRIFKLYMLLGFSSVEGGFDHYGFAFGANMPGFFNGRDIEGLMQFVSVGNSDASHITFYARTELGKHREEVYARKMARRGTMGPNNLYNQALELFYKGEYYRAYWIFSQIAVEYPDFFRNDMVSFYQGACLEGMDMRQSAITSFRRTKDDHSRSTAVPLADLGLMRVFYRGGDLAAVENQFQELNTLGVPDSIKYHAYYIMGQVNMQRGDFEEARRLFTMVPDNHPDYVFAYHSAAVSYMMADNLQGATADLEFVVQIKPKNKSQEEIINRSFVFLGFLYYEDLESEGALAKAVTALRKVPKNSYYYQDALLGLGWTALKARQWVDCISAGRELVQTSNDVVLQAEGLLIQSYANAMQPQRNYNAAVSLLEDAQKRLASYNMPSESDFSRNRSEYSDVRGDYEGMGSKIDELGQARQSSMVQTSIDSLQAPQGRMKTSIDGHLRFEDEFKRSSFFARGLEKVKDDIDYAQARFIRFKNASPQQGGSSSEDEEIRRLREQLEGLE
ncbi:MAG: tetratricopeptide repeat protein [Chitinispirillia bacterium]|nr:tetratricopeptide repeat protein [Chitinispirillia bacterium]MCL2241649.1 tetratricopeptide repeat protein [Chitinispirillia bacterium]